MQNSSPDSVTINDTVSEFNFVGRGGRQHGVSGHVSGTEYARKRDELQKFIDKYQDQFMQQVHDYFANMS